MSGADGLPVAGARVYVCTLADPFVSGDNAVRSDGEGRFSLEAAPETAPTLQVLAAGFQAWSEPLSGRTDLEVHLDPGLAIDGRVVDVTGAPVPGARVWAHRRGNTVAWPNSDARFPPPSLAAGGTATSDAEGRFSIGGLAAGGYEVRARKKGYSHAAWETLKPVPAGARAPDIVLLPVYRLVVRAVDARTGLRVAGALVSVSYPPPVTATGDLVRGEAASADAPEGPARDGTVRVSLVWPQPSGPPPAVRVWCQAPGYEPFGKPVVLQRPVEIRAELSPRRSGRAGQVRFRARFEKSSRPFGGVLNLFLVGEKADEKGLLTIAFRGGAATETVRLPPGHYRCRPSGCGDVGTWWTEAGPPFALEVAPEQVLEPAIALRGTLVDLEVVDAGGRPVRGYDLSVNPRRASPESCTAGTCPRTTPGCNGGARGTTAPT